MKIRVLLSGYRLNGDVGDYRVEDFDPFPYFAPGMGSQNSFTSLIEAIKNPDIHLFHLLTDGGQIDRLYRERNHYYMRMCNDFVDKFENFDIIVMSSYNYIHPEIFYRRLKKPIKVLGFVDDPVSTYMRGLSYLWAFDAAFYVSPSYIDGYSFADAFDRWSALPSNWFPLVPFRFQKPSNVGSEFFANRTTDVTYVGNYYGSKTDRLISLKKYFGHRFRVHGRWPLNGFVGFARAFKGRPLYPYRVTALTNQQRTSLYWDTKIGFNMHLSDLPSECGNMRTYEIPAHGMMMICDKASADAHAKIFEPNKEAVFYDDLDEAKQLINYYVQNTDERLRIAKAGYNRYWRDYDWDKNLLGFLKWCEGLKERNHEEMGSING